jgi:hypothetical protein
MASLGEGTAMLPPFLLEEPTFGTQSFEFLFDAFACRFVWLSAINTPLLELLSKKYFFLDDCSEIRFCFEEVSGRTPFSVIRTFAVNSISISLKGSYFSTSFEADFLPGQFTINRILESVLIILFLEAVYERRQRHIWC